MYVSRYSQPIFGIKCSLGIPPPFGPDNFLSGSEDGDIMREALSNGDMVVSELGEGACYIIIKLTGQSHNSV